MTRERGVIKCGECIRHDNCWIFDEHKDDNGTCVWAESRPKGKWIFNPTDAIDLMFAKPRCSKCGFESSDGGNFCPNCGADMRGGKE